MSRIANMPIEVPSTVTVQLDAHQVQMKGPTGELTQTLNDLVKVTMDDQIISVKASNESKASRALSGTMRALIANMVHGVSKGFERKLQLVGVGYRAQVQGSAVKLTLGFSHPVEHKLPEGVQAESASPTELTLKAADKQLLGQTAADIRSYRPPEPYKGKGVRYVDEYIKRKDAKKK